MVVYSSALPDSHPELTAARVRKIPTIKRAEMLGELTRLGFTVAVSGTHGKTTTTSLIGFLAEELDLDPTVIVGGRLISLPGNARVGSGPTVIEADEYDRSLLALHPTLAVMTNVDRDHMDCYEDFADICQTFLSYLQQVPFFGKVILNIDDPVQESFLPRINRPVITYGTKQDADFCISDVSGGEEGTSFRCDIHPGACQVHPTIPLYGIHNVFNATAALAAIWNVTEDPGSVRRAAGALPHFPGVSRRFERLGLYEGRVVISDYAHHPREVRAALEAAVQAYPDRPIVTVFQPHLFSRTRLFAREFAESLHSSKMVMVLPVYPAREEPIVGVTGESIVQYLRQLGHDAALFIEDVPTAFENFISSTDGDAVLLLLGAGSIHYYSLIHMRGHHES